MSGSERTVKRLAAAEEEVGRRLRWHADSNMLSTPPPHTQSQVIRAKTTMRSACVSQSEVIRFSLVCWHLSSPDMALECARL